MRYKGRSVLAYPPEFDYKLPMIAFVGPMGSGKSYAAENLFTNYHKLSLAGPLKNTARQYFRVTGKTNEERKILQELADDIKKWDNDVFTKLLLWTAYWKWEESDHDQTKELLPLIVDDLRFKHEADDLKRYGFILVCVSVSEEIRMARITEKYPDTDPSRFQHKSEKDWKNIKPDFTISGDGDEGLNNLREVLSLRYDG